MQNSTSGTKIKPFFSNVRKKRQQLRESYIHGMREMEHEVRICTYRKLIHVESWS